MSLSDLKKGNQKKVKQKDFTVEEFIADATNYAKGKPKVVSHKADTLEQMQLKRAKEKNIEDKDKGNKNQSPPFRRSTFTLSEEVIEQLQKLSGETKLAKSHIIRILIRATTTSEQADLLQKFINEHKPQVKN
tara:strand:- start:919 stop:1317 length:399 start_codon:yes stop_codon:yes gene_type:complete